MVWEDDAAHIRTLDSACEHLNDEFSGAALDYSKWQVDN
jgi:hypothetical protein